MTESTPSPESRLAELARRRADIEQRLSAARATHQDLQEEALMLVPQALLPLIKSGSTEDFQAVALHMATDLENALGDFARGPQKLDDALARFE